MGASAAASPSSPGPPLASSSQAATPRTPCSWSASATDHSPAEVAAQLLQQQQAQHHLGLQQGQQEQQRQGQGRCWRVSHSWLQVVDLGQNPLLGDAGAEKLAAGLQEHCRWGASDTLVQVTACRNTAGGACSSCCCMSSTHTFDSNLVLLCLEQCQGLLDAACSNSGGPPYYCAPLTGRHEWCAPWHCAQCKSLCSSFCEQKNLALLNLAACFLGGSSGQHPPGLRV